MAFWQHCHSSSSLLQYKSFFCLAPVFLSDSLSDRQIFQLFSTFLFTHLFFVLIDKLRMSFQNLKTFGKHFICLFPSPIDSNMADRVCYTIFYRFKVVNFVCMYCLNFRSLRWRRQGSGRSCTGWSSSYSYPAKKWSQNIDYHSRAFSWIRFEENRPSL